jgi:hypothetical protein
VPNLDNRPGCKNNDYEIKRLDHQRLVLPADVYPLIKQAPAYTEAPAAIKPTKPICGITTTAVTIAKAV